MYRHFISPAVLLAVVLLLGACGAQRKSSSGGVAAAGRETSAPADDPGPSAAEWRQGIKGKWVLNTVEREDIPAAYTVRSIFDEAPVDCFLGSVWYLPGGNYRGSITFHSTAGTCATKAVRTIVWSVYENKKEGLLPQFQFKKIYGGDRPKDIKSGYRLHLSYSDEQSLVMRMPVPLDNGSTGHLVFNFSLMEY